MGPQKKKRKIMEMDATTKFAMLENTHLRMSFF